MRGIACAAAVLVAAGCMRQATNAEAGAPAWAPTPQLAAGPPPYAAAPWPAWTPAAPASHPALPPSHAIPSGDACLGELTRLGVAFQRIASLKGVDTPIDVLGPVGGVRLRAGAGLPSRCDCRLAVALAWAAPRLLSLGIQELTFSGAYVYRTQRNGRPSLHARGLAIDVHAFGNGVDAASVKTAFAKGLGPAGCAPSAPLPNRAACALGETGLFKELLTPDSDADHHDHVHVAIAPLPPPRHDLVAEH